MILADSSILIEWQRMPSIRIYQIMTRYEAAICGVTVAEVAAGVRNDLERAKTAQLLGSFRRVAIDEDVWQRAGEVYGRLRRAGTPLMLADVTIAATAIHYKLPLWARDNHFARVQAVAPELVLFDEAGA